MIDTDLAALYETETKVLKQQVKRNIDRFPKDFMFQLTKVEMDQLVTHCGRMQILRSRKACKLIQAIITTSIITIGKITRLGNHT